MLFIFYFQYTFYKLVIYYINNTRIFGYSRHFLCSSKKKDNSRLIVKTIHLYLIDIDNGFVTTYSYFD